MDLFAGVDVGSQAAKAVVLDGEGRVVGRALLDTGPDFAGSARRALEEALARAGAGAEALRVLVGTGYGRASVAEAHRVVTEITCHARGVGWLFPQARLLLDVGGQDSKAIRLGPGGKVEGFAMNDKCAAGTGKFLSVLAQSLRTGVEGLGPAGLRAAKELHLSSTCTVFAESEVISLLSRGESVPDVAHAVHMAMARRLQGLVRQAGLLEPAVFTGGGALNADLVRSVEGLLGIRFEIPEEPAFTGALGAALLAREMVRGPLTP